MTYLDPEERRAKDRAATARYRAAHPEKAREAVAKYRAANPEKMRASNLDWYTKHPDKARAKNVRYRAEHPERINGQKRERYWADPEKARARHRLEEATWRAANPEKVRESTRRNGVKYRAAHPEKRRERRERDAKRRGAQACDHPACLALGPVALSWQTNPHVCWICGAPVWDGVNLHFDHVIPIAKGGPHCATNLRPACAPCNVKKGATLIAQEATA